MKKNKEHVLDIARDKRQTKPTYTKWCWQNAAKIQFKDDNGMWDNDKNNMTTWISIIMDWAGYKNVYICYNIIVHMLFELDHLYIHMQQKSFPA